MELLPEQIQVVKKFTEKEYNFQPLKLTEQILSNDMLHQECKLPILRVNHDPYKFKVKKNERRYGQISTKCKSVLDNYKPETSKPFKKLSKLQGYS